MTSIFLVDKKPDPKSPNGSSRPCTNLKPVNLFIHITYLSVPTVREFFPYLTEGYFASKLDLKISMFSYANRQSKCVVVVFPTQRTCASFEFFSILRKVFRFALPVFMFLLVGCLVVENPARFDQTAK